MEQAVRTSRSSASARSIQPAPTKLCCEVVSCGGAADFLVDLLGLGASGRGMSLTLGEGNHPPPPETLQDHPTEETGLDVPARGRTCP